MPQAIKVVFATVGLWQISTLTACVIAFFCGCGCDGSECFLNPVGRGLDFKSEVAIADYGLKSKTRPYRVNTVRVSAISNEVDN